MIPSRLALVVEDDLKISKLLVDYLEQDGFATRVVFDGDCVLGVFEECSPAVIILDYMLPGADGISLCKEIRRRSQVPILMLTARVDEIDRLLGLDSGADDYVCKPFSPRELIARVRALMRRSEAARIEPLEGWHIDEASFRIAWQGNWLVLTPIEFRLLQLFISHPGRVFSRNQLLEFAHADMRDVTDRAIDSHMKNIRRKFDHLKPGADFIESVYGVGYRFDSTRSRIHTEK